MTGWEGERLSENERVRGWRVNERVGEWRENERVRGVGAGSWDWASVLTILPPRLPDVTTL